MTSPHQPAPDMPASPPSTDRTAGMDALPDHAAAVAAVVKAVPCPTCHATVGEPCVTHATGGGTEPLADVHLTRYDAHGARKRRARPSDFTQGAANVMTFTGRCRHCREEFTYEAPGMMMGERAVSIIGPRSVCQRDTCQSAEADVVAERERVERETADTAMAHRRREQFTKWVPDLYHVAARPGHAATTAHIVPELADWQPGQSLYLSGPPGSGKSHQVACLMLRVAGRHTMEWYSTRRVIADLLASYSNKRVERPAIFGAPCASAVLVLNDLFAERSTEHTVTELGNVIDARYEAGLPIIVTSNLSLSEAAAKFDPRRADATFVQEELLRITTRLLEMTSPPNGTRHRMDELDWRTAIATAAMEPETDQ